MAHSSIVDEATVAALAAHARAALGQPADWAATPSSDAVALLVLDSFWSPDGTSDRAAADSALALYREMRDAEWGDAETDGADELIAQFDVIGGPAYFAEQLKKVAPDASSRKSLLSSAGALEACELLRGADLSTAEKLRSASLTTLRELERAWKRIAGQRSGETFNRVLLLVGCPTVIPDRRLIAFVGGALGSEPDPDGVSPLLSAAADQLAVPVQMLAYRIRVSG